MATMLAIIVASLFVKATTCQDTKRILLDDPSYIHTIEEKFQQYTEQISGLTEKVLELTALNQTVQELQTRLIDLERYRASRRSCETGSYALSSLHPAVKLPQTQTIHFHEAFQKAPVVTVGLAELDVNGEHNLRINVEASAITSQGFNIVFTSWADTDVYIVKASWIACPKE